MRKKLSEMTPYERVDQRMKGMSWEEAEDVGVEILAKCMALHAYVNEDGEEYIKKIMLRICERGDEWAHDNSLFISLARAGRRMKEELNDVEK